MASRAAGKCLDQGRLQDGAADRRAHQAARREDYAVEVAQQYAALRTKIDGFEELLHEARIDGGRQRPGEAAIRMTQPAGDLYRQLMG